MADMTIKDAKKDRLEAEEKISELLTWWERAYGLRVTALYPEHIVAPGEPNNERLKVSVIAKV